MLSVLAAGVAAGVLHVFSGPDHLAAVAPITLDSRRRRHAWGIGFRWGVGHSSGVLLVGVLSLMLRGLLPLDVLASWAERLVGVMLLGIGLWGLRSSLNRRVHSHEHAHHGRRHVHVHAHTAETAHTHVNWADKSHAHTHAAFAVGTLHGLAGSSHFLAIIPALAFPTKGQAMGYLIAYGVGTVLAMGTFSSGLDWLARRPAFAVVSAYRVLMMSCSIIAIGVGVLWLGS